MEKNKKLNATNMTMDSRSSARPISDSNSLRVIETLPAAKFEVKQIYTNDYGKKQPAVMQTTATTAPVKAS